MSNYQWVWQNLWPAHFNAMGLSSCTYRIQKTPYPQNCRVNLTLRYRWLTNNKNVGIVLCLDCTIHEKPHNLGISHDIPFFSSDSPIFPGQKLTPNVSWYNLHFSWPITFITINHMFKKCKPPWISNSSRWRHHE